MVSVRISPPYLFTMPSAKGAVTYEPDDVVPNAPVIWPASVDCLPTGAMVRTWSLAPGNTS